MGLTMKGIGGVTEANHPQPAQAAFYMQLLVEKENVHNGRLR
jgi:hypothetical protein